MPAYRLLEVSRLGAAAAAGGDAARRARAGARAARAGVRDGCRRAALPPGHGRRRAGRGQVAPGGGARRAGRVARRGSSAARCLSYGEGITFWAIGEIVRELAGIRDEHSAAEARALHRGARRRACRTGASSRRDRAAARARRRRRDRRRRRRGRSGSSSSRQPRERPLLVLVDDIHWAEPTLLDLLAGLPAAIERRADPAALPGAAGAARAPPGVARSRCASSRSASRRRRRAAREPARRGAGGRARAAREGLGGQPALRRGARGDARRRGRAAPRGRRLQRSRASSTRSRCRRACNALLGARLDRLDAEARDALERGAIEGELFHRGAVVELSPDESRAVGAGRLEALTRQGPRPPGRGELRRRGRLPLQAHPRPRRRLPGDREEAPRGAPRAVRRLARARSPASASAEYEEILGYHLEQSYRYRAELGPVDDEAQALGERAAGASRSGADGGRRRADVDAASGLLGRAAALLPGRILPARDRRGPRRGADGRRTQCRGRRAHSTSSTAQPASTPLAHSPRCAGGDRAPVDVDGRRARSLPPPGAGGDRAVRGARRRAGAAPRLLALVPHVA